MQKFPYVRVNERSPECEEADADDVIDLGAPRVCRPRAQPVPSPPTYVPNPRLYPGRPAKATPHSRRADSRPGSFRPRRRKRVLRQPVPNSRLYRPAPERAPPPPARPRAAWPPPAPARPLDTASRAALQLGERRLAGSGRTDCSPPPLALTPPAAVTRSRHLVVTLPTAAGGDSLEPRRYLPMDAASSAAAGRREPSPERASDSPSAPSEYLAEFLSAIMRRQYAEALKYCRLILQYEPQNATARGFHPLLQQKLAARAADWDAGSCSSSGSERSEESSLELPSASECSSRISDSRSRSGSPRSASSRSRSRSDADGNGNLLPPALPETHTHEDLENDNTTGDDTQIKTEGAAALRRLRAQFACSIK